MLWNYPSFLLLGTLCRRIGRFHAGVHFHLVKPLDEFQCDYLSCFPFGLACLPLPLPSPPRICLPAQMSCHFQIEKPNEISRRFAAFMIHLFAFLPLHFPPFFLQLFIFNLFLPLHPPLFSIHSCQLPALNFVCTEGKRNSFSAFLFYTEWISGGEKNRCRIKWRMSQKCVSVCLKCHLFLPFPNICPSAESTWQLHNSISLQLKKLKGK